MTFEEWWEKEGEQLVYSICHDGKIHFYDFAKACRQELEQEVEMLRGALIFVLNHPCIKYNKRFSHLRENMFSMITEIAQQALGGER